MTSLFLKLSNKILLLSLIFPRHRSTNKCSFRLDFGNFDELFAFFYSIVFVSKVKAHFTPFPFTTLAWTLWHKICPIKHKIFHQKIRSAFFQLLWSKLQIHCLAFFVIVIDCAPLLSTCLTVVTLTQASCEIVTNYPHLNTRQQHERVLKNNNKYKLQFQKYQKRNKIMQIVQTISAFWNAA